MQKEKEKEFKTNSLFILNKITARNTRYTFSKAFQNQLKLFRFSQECGNKKEKIKDSL